MDGPSHYREAEQWLDLAGKYEGLPSAAHIQAAQISQAHATLALAAAMALPGDTEGVWPAWRAVAS
jgi:hypothetical protein